jgi:LysM repeat protein
MKSHALTFVILVAFCSMQVLAYPAPNIDARSSSNGTGIYIVESGDTLDSIAANEGITPEQLEDANPGVSPTDLQVGETLILPDSASSNGTISNGTSSNETR